MICVIILMETIKDLYISRTPTCAAPSGLRAQALPVPATERLLTHLTSNQGNAGNFGKENWPAPGSEDTELGVLMELEVGHGETEVYARVQA
jgi:hypothetical protein